MPRRARIDWRAHVDPARTLACEFTRPAPGDHAHAVRRAAAQGRDLRPAARDARARGRISTRSGPRCACTRMPTARRSRCTSIWRARACIAAATAAQAARRRCARTSPPACCCAPAGRRSPRAGARVPRSDVRLGHAGHRGGADRRRHRARPAARLLGLPRLARPRRRAVVARWCERGARQRDGGDPEPHPRHRPRCAPCCAPPQANARRAGVGRTGAVRGSCELAAVRPRRARRRAACAPIRPTASASVTTSAARAAHRELGACCASTSPAGRRRCSPACPSATRELRLRA